MSSSLLWAKLCPKIQAAVITIVVKMRSGFETFFTVTKTFFTTTKTFFTLQNDRPAAPQISPLQGAQPEPLDFKSRVG